MSTDRIFTDGRYDQWKLQAPDYPEPQLDQTEIDNLLRTSDRHIDTHNIIAEFNDRGEAEWNSLLELKGSCRDCPADELVWAYGQKLIEIGEQLCARAEGRKK